MEKTMSMSEPADVLAIVESWAVETRIAFVQVVMDRLDQTEFDPDMTDELKEELDRRIAAYRANPEKTIPWEQVYAETMARLRQ
jgi:putative addiction module component (TIGR02574 family)